MSNGLHLELDKKTIEGSTSSQNVLILQKAGPFTVHIKEYSEFLKRKEKLDPTKGKTLVDSAKEREIEEIAILSEDFAKVNWCWNTVYSLHNLASNHNLSVGKGITFEGKEFHFPEVLEGGGYCYLEAFLEGKSPIGKTPYGMLVKAIGSPKLIRIEWTDMQYNPIKETKVAFGSHLLLHIYTEGMYGQEILVGLKDLDGNDKDLNIANSSFFDVEVKTYPVKPFEDKQDATSGSLGKANDKNAVLSIQKAEIKVGIDYAWVFAGKELEIEVEVLQKTTTETLGTGDKKNRLNVSEKEGKEFNPTPEITNMPVVVGEIDTIAKPPKKPIDFTFGVFLDGTLNNMYNTELRQLAKGKDPKKTTGLNMSRREAIKVHNSVKKEEDSYENDLSNPAILFKNYREKPQEKIFKVYTDGIGTNTSPAMPKATEKDPNPIRNTTLGKDDYKKDDKILGPAFGQGTAGIMDKVKKSIEDVVSIIKAQEIDEDHCVGTITFDVFGFSRGAAAARHFVHIVKHGPYIPYVPKVYEAGYGTYVWDLQNNNLPLSYKGKLMPQFGLLGQLLTEADLMDEALTKINVRFVGIYDTVPHHGLIQDNDISDLGLNNVNRADYVVHMVAADEHRSNFSLVHISTVAKVSPESKKIGGIELFYPGVHCDVGGSYEEGREDNLDNPKRIDSAMFDTALTPLKDELIQQGWFSSEKELFTVYDPISIAILTKNYYRLEGKRKLSNQYSYIPLHIMAEFCTKKEVPITESSLYEFKYFKANFIKGNVAFLEKVKEKLKAYSFDSGAAMVYKEEHLKPVIDPITNKADEKNVEYNIKEKLKNRQIKFLRNHYLHWNSSYDITNLPNIEGNERKRHTR